MEAYRKNVGSEAVAALWTFESLCARWYYDFFIDPEVTTNITDDTGKENGIFAAFGVDYGVGKEWTVALTNQ